MFKLIFSLTIVTIICSSLLAMIYSITKKPIEKAEIIQKSLKIESVFESLEPDNNPIEAPYYFVTGNGDTIQKGYLALKNGDTVGIALEDTGIGYGGKIIVLTGIDLRENSITSIEILSQSETPGLGAKVIDLTWREQFSGKSLDNSILVNGSISVKKDGGDIDAISGATISPRAVCFAVNQSLHLIDSVNTGESR